MRITGRKIWYRMIHRLGQFKYLDDIVFDPSPTTSTPLAPTTHDIVNACGFSGNGRQDVYTGYPAESCDGDIFAAHLITGAARRVKGRLELRDQALISRGEKWIAMMDNHESGRPMFIVRMRGIPPIVDLVGATLPSST
ncbi:hypothetical protein BKA67DRAFT_542761 [Truncatella angustata]|uniref:Uncharacterized protein n=1 Tax=Truncatella angustata TaxID=152316 RepID=A0A9P8RE94_9PEZI|nr:uncharacterized protein BKA67DRAFT_542761 [Truncatella angustata]KAH6638660.1 hypothetical protein BKA67DRAFT_542761 [Truncatella angustata]